MFANLVTCNMFDNLLNFYLDLAHDNKFLNKIYFGLGNRHIS